MSIHDCLLAVPHGSLPIEIKTLQAASEGLPPYDSTSFSSIKNACLLAEETTPPKPCNVRGSRTYMGKRSNWSSTPPPSVWPPKLGDCILLKPRASRTKLLGRETLLWPVSFLPMSSDRIIV